MNKEIEEKDKKKERTRGDRIGNAFSRFPMLVIRIIQVLLNNRNDVELSIFLKELGVTEKWFKDTCKNSKIFNTFTLDNIDIFEIYQVTRSNRTIEKIKLKDRLNWENHYKDALNKVLKE